MTATTPCALDTLVLAPTARPGRRGFTLIELMVTVAIVAILAAIAIPNYLRYAQRSRRSDAYAAFSLDQGILERCYAQTFDYSKVNSTSPPAGCNALPATSPGGFYAIALAAGTSGALSTSYKLTASPASGSPQARDTTCASISVTSENVKSASDAGGNDQTATCWQQ
ncbi:MAG TPA: type IV pilin protein [Frateuria sp.]|uniref:type IV pilin protein n=1 Tax=Frateuria sp. TaxID=2211372 RepID=UPI002DF72E75|nr:type IV pilin protein [Frateuria sp.]